MATQEVKLPEIGEGVNEGELIEWLVAAGDTVEEDQPIVEIMTDKATVEVPAPFGGTVKELKAQPGDMVAIGGVLLTLDTSGSAAKADPAPAAQQEAPTPKAAPETTTQAAAPAAAAAPSQSAGSMDVYPAPAEISVLATPSTRRLAREMSVDINAIEGTGLAGRVTREDVLGRGKTQTPSAPSFPKTSVPTLDGELEERVPLRGIRKKIAENMQMSKHIVPHFTLMDEANITEFVELREELKEWGQQNDVKITYLPFIMKALIATVREFPAFNASIDDEAQEIVYKRYFNIGFAADTPQGLLVPVIKNADQKSVLELSKEIVDLAVRARDGKLKLDEMRGSCFTITNIGSLGGTYATPIINHPEVAIFGMYKIQDRPVWRNNTWEPAKFMNFTVTCDHRLIDGAEAARFLSAFIQRMENPGRILLDLR